MYDKSERMFMNGSNQLKKNMRIESMQIRKLQRLFSVSLLVSIILLMAPHLVAQVEMKVQAPTQEVTRATRLMIFHEGYNIELERPTELAVRAVNDEGIVDPTRNDLVELNITSLSYLVSQTKLSTATLRLQNGTGTVTLIGYAMEVIRLTAASKDAKSEIKPAVTILNVGVGGE